MARTGYAALTHKHRIAHKIVASVTAAAFFLNTTIVPVMAQGVKPDANAPAANRPTVNPNKDGNGVPIVEIAKPNASGLSHNKYEDFNVGQEGLILNNSTKAGKSDSGGYIFGNPNLDGDSAKIILNEVTGGGRSSLQGYIEVFGPAAEFILANPNGITCAGCGFHNIPRATLATGTPTFDGNGAFKGLSVNGGDIRFENGAKGFAADARGADYFDIVSRSIAINGAIHGQDVGLYAGRNDFDYAVRQVIAKADDGSGKPAFGIDSSLLGGVYANKITIVGTEKGVGMNAPREMTAAAGGISLTNDGKIVLGSAASKGKITVRAKRGPIEVASQKAVWSETALELTSDSGVSLLEKSFAGAKGNVTIKAGSGALALAAEAVAAAGIQADSTFTTTGMLTVEAGLLQNQGGLLTAAQDVTIDLTGGTSSNSGTVLAQGTLRLIGGGGLVNEAAGVIAGQKGTDIKLAALGNRGKVLSQGGALTIQGDLYNEGDIGSAGLLSVSAGSLFNTANGRLISDTATTINAVAITNAGVISAGTALTVNAQGNIYNAQEGILFAKADVDIKAVNLANDGGMAGATGGIQSETGTVRATLTGALQNAGVVYGKQGLAIDAAGVHNKLGGQLISSGLLTIVTSPLHNEGEIKATEYTITVNQARGVHGPEVGLGQAYAAIGEEFVDYDKPIPTSGVFINSGLIYSAARGELNISAPITNNEGGEIASDGNLTIRTTSSLENKGDITGFGLLQIAAGTHLDNRGQIFSENALAIEAGGTLVNSGSVLGKAALSALAEDINNAGALGSTDGVVQLRAEDEISNIKLIYAGTDLIMALGGTLYNRGGSEGWPAEIVAENNMWIVGLEEGKRARGVSNSSGLIETFSGNLVILADRVSNHRSVNPSFERVHVGTTEHKTADGKDVTTDIWEDRVDWTNATPAGQIVSGGHMAIDATSITNTYSLIASSGDMSLTAATLENTGRELTRSTQTSTTTHHSRKYCDTRILGICVDKDTARWDTTEHQTTYETTGRVGSTIQAGGTLQGSFTDRVDNVDIKSYAGAAAITRTTLAGGTRGAHAIGGGGLSQATLPSGAAITIREGGLISASPNPGSGFVYETDPRFADAGNFFGSDRFLDKLDINPIDLGKRLGDAYVERTVILDQLFNTTGRRVLVGYTDPDAMIEALYDNAVEEAKRLNLTPGIALTPEQAAALQKDIIWLVPVTVNGQTVLAPQVYLSNGSITANANDGAAIRGGNVSLTAPTLLNEGAITSGGNLFIGAGTLENVAGSITAQGDMGLEVGSLLNRSGLIAGHNVAISANVVHNETEVFKDRYDNGYREQLGSTAIIAASGDLAIQATKIETGEGGTITSIGGQILAGGNAQLVAEGDINIVAQQTSWLREDGFGSIDYHTEHEVELATLALDPIGGWIGLTSRQMFGDDNEFHVRNQLSGVSAGGNLAIESGGKVQIVGGEIAWGGDALISGAQGVVVASVHDVDQHEFKLHVEKSAGTKLLNPWSNDVDISSSSLSARNIGSSFTGNNLTIHSEGGNVELGGATRIETDSAPVISTPNGQVVFKTEQDVDYKQTVTSERSLFWQRQNDKGHERNTVRHVEIHNNAGGAVDVRAGKGVVIEHELKPIPWAEVVFGGAEMPTPESRFNDSLDDLSKREGHAWMGQMRDRSDVQWTGVEPTSKKWDDTTQSLSTEGVIVVTVVITVVTYGAGSAAAGALGAVQGTFAYAAISAGTQALINTAAISTINNLGNPVEITKDIFSLDTLKTVGVAALTAGIMAEVTPLITSGAGLDAASLQTAGLGKIPSQFVEGAITNTAGAFVNATVNTVAYGGDFGKNLAGGLKMAAINTVAAAGATAIGDAHRGGQLGDGALGEGVRYAAHAGLGCVAGQAAGGDCKGGAIGAVAGEFAADIYRDRKVQELAGKTKSAMEQLQAGTITAEQFGTWLNGEVKDAVAQGANVGELFGAVAATAVGGKGNIGGLTGSNAAEHNDLCGGLCIGALILAAAYIFEEGDGNPVKGVEKIGKGEDTISDTVATATEKGVNFVHSLAPEETEAVLTVLSLPGQAIDATVTYIDEKTGKVVSSEWNKLDESTRNQLAGTGKVISVFLPGASAKALKAMKEAKLAKTLASAGGKLPDGKLPDGKLPDLPDGDLPNGSGGKLPDGSGGSGGPGGGGSSGGGSSGGGSGPSGYPKPQKVVTSNGDGTFTVIEDQVNEFGQVTGTRRVVSTDPAGNNVVRDLNDPASYTRSGELETRKEDAKWSEETRQIENQNADIKREANVPQGWKGWIYRAMRLATRPFPPYE